MNRQQLAAKIWKSSNKMRSKIETNEYVDNLLRAFILEGGFEIELPENDG